MFKVGEYVTRNKYGNDIVFIIDKIDKNNVYLKGVDVRLYADVRIDANDLVRTAIPKKKELKLKVRNVDNSKYFYIIPSLLHLDSDKNYLDKCLEYYKEQGIKAKVYLNSESEYTKEIENLIAKYNPKIIVVTGHDAYYKKKKNGKYYKNSEYFISTVKKIRSIDKSIVIFAGACQSDYINLIKEGASFASSPSHINIHALDPAIIASYIAFTDTNETININEIINTTHYKEKGIGGIIIKGKMITGYPRGDKN